MNKTEAPKTADLRNQIEALVQLNDRGALVPHGIGELARSLLLSASDTITSLEAEVERLRMELELRRPTDLERADIQRLRQALKSLADRKKRAPVQGLTGGIPWDMHLRAYDAYCKKYRAQPALIDLEGRNCRGGFGTGELDDFIPGWRDELSVRVAQDTEIVALKAECDRLKADLAEACELIRQMQPITVEPMDFSQELSEDVSRRASHFMERVKQ